MHEKTVTEERPGQCSKIKEKVQAEKGIRKDKRIHFMQQF